MWQFPFPPVPCFQCIQQPFRFQFKISFAQWISCHACAQSFIYLLFRFLFSSGDSFCCICVYPVTCGWGLFLRQEVGWAISVGCLRQRFLSTVWRCSPLHQISPLYRSPTLQSPQSRCVRSICCCYCCSVDHRHSYLSPSDTHSSTEVCYICQLITPGQAADVTLKLHILPFLLFPKCISIGLRL